MHEINRDGLHRLIKRGIWQDYAVAGAECAINLSSPDNTTFIEQTLPLTVAWLADRVNTAAGCVLIYRDFNVQSRYKDCRFEQGMFCFTNEIQCAEGDYYSTEIQAPLYSLKSGVAVQQSDDLHLQNTFFKVTAQTRDNEPMVRCHTCERTFAGESKLENHCPSFSIEFEKEEDANRFADALAYAIRLMRRVLAVPTSLASPLPEASSIPCLPLPHSPHLEPEQTPFPVSCKAGE